MQVQVTTCGANPMQNLRVRNGHKSILGLIHLVPLPGTPHYEPGNVERALEKALFDAHALHDGGADGGLIQPTDRTYPVGEEVDPARLAAFASIVSAVRKDLPSTFELGVQILWNATRASLGVAFACGASFVRSANFIGSSHSLYGPVHSDPVRFLNYVNQLGAHDVSLVAEIQSMHYKSLENTSLAKLAETAYRTGAHAVEIAEPDQAKCLEMVSEIREAVPDLPIMLGGHTNHANAEVLLSAADGAFVGTCFQPEGWGTNISVERVKAYMEIVRKSS